MGLFDNPLLTALGGAERVLIAGAGGGFDVFCGIPLYFALRAQRREVHLANLSFSRLDRVVGRHRSPSQVEVTADTAEIGPYFPELHLARSLRKRGIEQSVHAFAQSGVKPLVEAYRALVDDLKPDAIVLVDGGTDSLMRGDEVGLGTPQEDAASLLAVEALDVPVKLLTCVGFGVDRFHGVRHVDFLERVADLTRLGAYLGAFALTADMPEMLEYKAITRESIEANPTHPSIVSTSILSAVDGHFGDFHATERTWGSALFINALMPLVWTFRLADVARAIKYADIVRHTETYLELSSAIERWHSANGATVSRTLPM